MAKKSCSFLQWRYYESRKRLLGHSVKCNVSNVGIGHIKKGMRLKLKMALPWTQDGIWYIITKGPWQYLKSKALSFFVTEILSHWKLWSPSNTNPNPLAADSFNIFDLPGRMRFLCGPRDRCTAGSPAAGTGKGGGQTAGGRDSCRSDWSLGGSRDTLLYNLISAYCRVAAWHAVLQNQNIKICFNEACA